MDLCKKINKLYHGNNTHQILHSHCLVIVYTIGKNQRVYYSDIFPFSAGLMRNYRKFLLNMPLPNEY